MKRCAWGFTLAELLIALAILGVIATFTIPKVLQAQQNSQNNSIAKEAAATISGSFQAYKMNNTVTDQTKTLDLTPYMNYVAVDTTTDVDDHYTSNSFNCSTTLCLKLHNGAMLYTWNINFAGTNDTNAIYFYLDPDGHKTDNTTNSPGKSVVLFLYPNGRLTTYGNILTNTTSSFGLHVACPTCDPPWFSWN